MKQALPNLLKFIGVLALATLIYFLILPDKEFKDEALNASLEFLGKKLLAMTPKEQQTNVEKEFDKVREQTLEGKVSDEHLENFAVAVLNAEAEGRHLEQNQIDSLLNSMQTAEAKRRTDERRLRALGERLQTYQRFEYRWKQMMPEADSEIRHVPPPRPLYRIERNFVVQIDTAAIAEVIAAHAGEVAAAVTPAITVSTPAVGGILQELSRELPDLQIELGQVKTHIQMADSLKKIHFHMADSLRKVALKNKAEQRRMMRLPVPPAPPEETRPEKP
jgi:hypothetical protein